MHLAEKSNVPNGKLNPKQVPQKDQNHIVQQYDNKSIIIEW